MANKPIGFVSPPTGKPRDGRAKLIARLKDAEASIASLTAAVAVKDEALQDLADTLDEDGSFPNTVQALSLFSHSSISRHLTYFQRLAETRNRD